MAGASGGKVIAEARAGIASGARRKRQARPAPRAIRDAIIVPVRKRDCARSGSAPHEFKLFQKSAKWFLSQESWLGEAPGICYSRRTREDQQQCSKPHPGARAGPERGRRAEHDRDRGDRPVRGQFAGDTGDGRAASAHRVAGRCAPGDAGCLCMVRAGRGDAESRRNIRLSQRSLRSGAVGPVDVLFVRVANVGTSAAFRGVGVDWLRKVCWIPVPLHAARGQGDFRRTSHLDSNVALPANRDERKIPRGIFLSVLGIAVLYLAMQTSILGVVPWREAQNSDFIASLFVERLYGQAAARFATGMILWIAVASAFSVLLGASRVPYSAAQDGNFFPVFAKVHPTKHFPHVSLLVLAGLAFLFSISLKLKQAIAGILAMRLLVQFIGQAVGVILLRRRRGTQGLPFKMWFYPLPAVLTMIGWAWLFWQTGATRKWGLAEIALGALAFLIRAREMRQWPFGNPQPPVVGSQ